jgi:hypothetical protein
MKRAKKSANRAPRNPLVAVVKFKKAGAHGKTGKVLRRDEKIKIKKLVSSTGIEPVIDP